MKVLAVLSVIVGVVSIIVGIVFKLISIFPLKIYPISYLVFANTMFLLAIALSMLKMIGMKK